MCLRGSGLKLRVHTKKKKNFLISQTKHILWVLKGTVSFRPFFLAPKTFVKIDGFKNIYNFMLKNFVYLNLLGSLYFQKFNRH